MLFITHVRLSVGGTGHEHIVHVMWRNSDNGATGEATLAEVIEYIEIKRGEMWVASGAYAIPVLVVGHKYIRTLANGVWSDNLLALPRF